MREDYISGCGHLSIVMPQENFTLIDFDLDKSVDSLRKSRIITGDFDNDIIDHNKGKLCLHIKVESEDVSFQLSLNGKLQISSPNAELLRRANSQLRELIACSRWVPTSPIVEKTSAKEPRKKKTLREKYPSLMDLPEAKKADWTKMSRNEINYINRLWAAFQFSDGYEFLLDPIRSELASYAKSNDNAETKDNKSLKGKVKELLGVNAKK